VRARKEGSSKWNEVEPKRFVRTYGKKGEDIREGFEPTDDPEVVAPKSGDGAGDFTVGDDEDADAEGSGLQDSEESRQWKETQESELLLKPKYGTLDEENVWAGGEPSQPALFSCSHPLNILSICVLHHQVY